MRGKQRCWVQVREAEGWGRGPAEEGRGLPGMGWLSQEVASLSGIGCPAARMPEDIPC